MKRDAIKDLYAWKEQKDRKPNKTYWTPTTGISPNMLLRPRYRVYAWFGNRFRDSFRRRTGSLCMAK